MQFVGEHRGKDPQERESTRINIRTLVSFMSSVIA